MLPSSPAPAILIRELTDPAPSWPPLDGYATARVLCRLRGRPLGWVTVPIDDGRVDETALRQQLLERYGWAFVMALAERELASPASADESVEQRVARLLEPAAATRTGPLVTVAVCTRNRPDDLAACLEALQQLAYLEVDLLVVDNAPADDRTAALVRTRFPRVRYVRENRPGLDWARNRAVAECRGEILAFTDDDVIVDPLWVSALVDVFACDPAVMAVTGLVIPHELGTRAQRLFEIYGGFGRGVTRRWYRADTTRPVAPVHGGAGKFGTGANMAFRRELFDRIGAFDPALDVGTRTNGGGDLEMFFRVLKTGHTLVYEPAAIVRHRHRREYHQLRTQIANNGVGFYSYLVRTADAYPEERLGVFRFGLWWFYWWSLRRFVRALLRKEPVGLDLVSAELVGSVQGLFRYSRARRAAAALGDDAGIVASRAPARASRPLPDAVRVIDLTRPLTPISDAAAYQRVRVIVSHADRPVGFVTIEHQGAVVNPVWLRDAIGQQLPAQVLDPAGRTGAGILYARAIASLADCLDRAPAGPPPPVAPQTRLPDGVPVSVVVATYDRPADLSRCLASLLAQQTARPLQIVVVDNHPASGLTRDVASAFPGVTLVEEVRGGLSYARNRGIAAATGEIIVCTDDDVVCPPEWLERLVAPFRHGDVMVVTGNVLPASLETEAERLFELYGGLGRGFGRFTVDGEWFSHGRRAVPTWRLGCTANAAFRASIFSDPVIGPMDEALGAGTPTGCSEDTLVFYRVLKAGYTIAYEPTAYVWHRHRATMKALRKQIYAYSKGHVAYHLTTWLQDGDIRGLVRVLYELPVTHARRALDRLRGASDYPLSMLMLEVLGNLAGPFALWRSRRRVRRLGVSDPQPARSHDVVHA